MRIIALQLELATFPTAILADVGTAFWVIEEEIGWSTEVLLAMRIVALAPVVNRGVTNWAEGCLVAVEHELVIV